MGYTTDFKGSFKLGFSSGESKEKVTDIVNGLAKTRRMARDLTKIESTLKHPISYYGVEGEFYYEDTEDFGQNNNGSVLNFNKPPKTQPGLWLHWEVIGDNLEWNGSEKFYGYVRWLQYLIDNIFIPNGVIVEGEVEWFGEDRSDTGVISVSNNKIKTRTI